MVIIPMFHSFAITGMVVMIATERTRSIIRTTFQSGWKARLIFALPRDALVNSAAPENPTTDVVIARNEFAI